MPGDAAWEEDTRLSDLLVAESEPDHHGIPGPADIPPGFPPLVLVLSYRPPAGRPQAAYRLRAACGLVEVAAEAPPLAAGTAGRSSVTVRPPPGVSVIRAVAPLEVASRCTMARPSPVPFGFEVLNRRNALSRSSAVMPGPLSLTTRRAPDCVAVALTTTWSPGLSASRALAIRLSRICSRCPSPTH